MYLQPQHTVVPSQFQTPKTSITKPHSPCSPSSDNVERSWPNRTLAQGDHPASPSLPPADAPTAPVFLASPVSSSRNELSRLSLLSPNHPPSPTQVREAVRHRRQESNRHALPPTPPEVSGSLQLGNRRIATPKNAILKEQPLTSAVQLDSASSRALNHPARAFNLDPRQRQHPAGPTRSRSQNLHPPPLAYRAGLGPHLHSISIDASLRLPPVEIRSVRLVGGYKWIESLPGLPGPTIVVPGVPDVWVGRDRPAGPVKPHRELDGNVEYANCEIAEAPRPTRLRSDNRASVPHGSMSFEPVFHSLLNPGDLRDMRILTARNNLEKLFCFCAPSSNKNTFRIDATVLPGTELVLLHRWDTPQASRAREPSNHHLAFHEENTLKIYKGPDRTPGCHRIIKYVFGGMTIMVVFDVGAALPWEGMFSPSTSKDLRTLYDDTSSEADDAMSVDTDFRTCATFGSVRLPISDPDLHSLSSMTASGIRIVPGPVRHPPQAHLISLKTRLAPLAEAQDLAKINHVEEVYAGLLFGQIPNLYLARHQGGLFAPDIQRFVLGQGALSDLDMKYDQAVRRVRHVLGWMVNVTMSHRKAGFVGHYGEITAFVSEKQVDKLSKEEAWETVHASGAYSRRRDVAT